VRAPDVRRKPGRLQSNRQSVLSTSAFCACTVVTSPILFVFLAFFSTLQRNYVG
jgi:hypothetical protein